MGLAIYDCNRPGFKGVLVDTDKKIVIKELVKVTDGWGIAVEYKKKNRLRCNTIRIARPFKSFDDVISDSLESEDITKPPVNEQLLKKYNIATRFEFMEELINMVIDGISPSCIITGPGGIGKTYSVIDAMREQKYKEGEDYVVVKGFTTPRGLYDFLFDHNNQMIIFDDCDSAFKDPTALNLMKGALDSTDRRIISWNSSRLPEGIPPSFEFKGRIIFVSNIPLNGFDQTLISRSMVIDLQMSREEILDRINTIKDHILPASNDAKNDTMKFLMDRKDSISDLNIRTYMKVLKVRCYANAERWEGMSEFMCCS